MRAPVARARAMSRATITSSATAGIPGIPRRLDHSPSCMAPSPASGPVLAVLGQGDPEPPGVVEGPAHEAGRLDPGAVVGEQAHPQVGQLGHGGQALAGPAHGDGPGHRHLGGGRRRPARARSGPPRPSRAPARCWAWPPRRCTRPATRPGCRSRWSRPPRGRAGGGGCADRPGPARPHSRRRRAPGLPSGRRCPRRPRPHDPVGDHHVGAPLAGLVDHGAAPDHQGREGAAAPASDPLSHGGRPRSAPGRAGGRARPSGWPPRCSPAR